mmetsp:Transcript_29061/g.76687  ORF Transcript_29061/g.76687 Transcript_29061/m.76687 type:complete len:209 (+) Transcript_29061:151-777(+)
MDSECRLDGQHILGQIPSVIVSPATLDSPPCSRDGAASSSLLLSQREPHFVLLKKFSLLIAICHPIRMDHLGGVRQVETGREFRAIQHNEVHGFVPIMVPFQHNVEGRLVEGRLLQATPDPRLKQLDDVFTGLHVHLTGAKIPLRALRPVSLFGVVRHVEVVRPSACDLIPYPFSPHCVNVCPMHGTSLLQQRQDMTRLSLCHPLVLG